MELAELKSRILGGDVIGRDSDTYTHSRKDGRLGWEADTDSCLSSYATDNATVEDALTKAYSLASDMLSVMEIPQRVHIRIDRRSPDSYTDSKVLNVSTKHFDDENVSVGERTDVFVGLTVHEGCHLLYTDFKAGASKDRLTHTLCNILEDERIEHRLGDEKPGLAGFLATVKDYHFRRYAQTAPAGDPVLDAVNAVLYLVRYPASLTDDMLLANGELLLKVKDILSPYPATTAEAYAAAERIVELLRDTLREKEAEKESGKDESSDKGSEDGDIGESKDAGGDSSESGDSGKDETSPGKESRDENGSNKDSASGTKDTSSEEGSENSSSSADGNGDGDSDDTSASSRDGSHSDDGSDGTEPIPGDDSCDGSDSCPDTAGQKGGDAWSDLSDDEKEAMERRLSEALDKAAERMRELSKDNDGLEDDESCDAVRKNRNLERFCSGEMERGESPDTIVIPVRESNELEYERSLENVRQYVPAMRRAVQCGTLETKYALKGMRNGHFDAGKIAEAVQGCPTVYTRECEVKSDKLAVCILIDESGSMACDCGRTTDGEYVTRIDAARDAAILLNEALSGQPNVELFIYGHSADQYGKSNCELYVYRDRKVKAKRNLGCCDARCNNADGYAILETAARVRKQTDRKCLMFVISDGEPAANVYGGYEGVRHTAEAVRKVSKMGFIPVQVAISAEIDPARMFKDFVKFTDLSQLPLELGRIIKKAVLDNAKREVRY